MPGFSEIIGHEQIIDHLQNAIRLNKVSHAYILNGAERSGKMMLAEAFATALPNYASDLTKSVDAAIGEQPVDLLKRQAVDLRPRREPLLIEDPASPGDGAMRTPRHRLDLPIRIPLQQQAHHKPVVRHRDVPLHQRPALGRGENHPRTHHQSATVSPRACYQIVTSALPEASSKHR